MKHLLRISFLLCFIINTTCVLNARTTIYVRNQEQFDRLQEDLVDHINAGESNIFIKLFKGTYIFKENHLTIKDINAPKTKIHLIGKDIIIIPEGKDYHNGDVFEGHFSPDDSWMEDDIDVDAWAEVMYSDGLVEIIDKSNKRCRLKTKEYIADSIDASGAYILIPHWYKSSVYEVERIEDGYIYFTATDLAGGYKIGYNVNDDFNYGNKEIRYKLCNVNEDNIHVKNGRLYLPSNIAKVREGKAHRFLMVANSHFHSFELKGLSFWGCKNDVSNHFIKIQSCNFNRLLIHDCDFHGMKGDVIRLSSSSNAVIENNRFVDCYFRCVYSDNNSSNTTIKGNSFLRTGKRMDNTLCIYCLGEDFRVIGNYIEDFGYGGICTGLWYKTKKPNPCIGVIEGNTLVLSNSYALHIDNYGLMDAGAIYLCTQMDSVIIRNNYINNITGLSSNRGIFCDDGAYNVQIFGNVITNVANSYCIDSRRVSYVEQKNDSSTEVFKANINNAIRDNLIDERIRFEGNEIKQNGCVKGSNYFVVKAVSEVPRNTYNNVAFLSNDVYLTNKDQKGTKIILSKDDYKILRKSSEWSYLRKFVTHK